ncbi:MAG: hypothetical protein CFH22_01224 [Alphaproteobacteria bacterium MarineAlpha5_Bin12]|nr:MAG: hypothetical protein CFH22_01224 [Alphaproteobacteria bacterium MarineAlpha5_Bin12]|tara:strand:+ start:1204 stop:1581 length:378 start_codon:yes stop_codon:yes gene_type:complete
MDKNKIRPLSPHLTIHKKIPSAIFSITHRITGFGLYLGTIIIVIFLFYFGLDENNFLLIKILNNILIIQIFFFLWFFSILYHLINGLRYLIWSTGYFINLKFINISGYLVIVFSLLLTILILVKY